MENINFKSASESDREENTPKNDPLSRRSFLKKLGIGTAVLATSPATFANSLENKQPYTQLIPTNETFKNGEYVYKVEHEGQRVGEFWPISGINLVTKETHPELFTKPIEQIIDELDGVATAPDGMSTGSVGQYKMEGKALANGIPCGDGQVYQYGIIHVKGGFNINFTHKKEIPDFDIFYETAKKNKDTIFFLPSIYRNGNALVSEAKVDKVLVRRNVPDGQQIGAIIFDNLVSYNKAREIVLGLDRAGKSETTHIYILDGGGAWGQSAKKVNGEKHIIGTRNTEVVTNYLVFY